MPLWTVLGYKFILGKGGMGLMEGRSRRRNERGTPVEVSKIQCLIVHQIIAVMCAITRDHHIGVSAPTHPSPCEGYYICSTHLRFYNAQGWGR